MNGSGFYAHGGAEDFLSALWKWNTLKTLPPIDWEQIYSPACHVEVKRSVTVSRRETSGNGSGMVNFRELLQSIVSGEPEPEQLTPEQAAEKANRALNSRAVFLAFVRAAHGKVRHSVRWKTSKRLRAYEKLKGFISVEHTDPRLKEMRSAYLHWEAMQELVAFARAEKAKRIKQGEWREKGANSCHLSQKKGARGRKGGKKGCVSDGSEVSSPNRRKK